MIKIKSNEISDILIKELSNFDYNNFNEIGTILKIGDGIASIYGLKNVFFGELIKFDNNINGIVLTIEEDIIDVVLLGSYKEIKEGDKVQRIGKLASVKSGKGLLGRILNALGKPIDEIGSIKGDLFEMPIERKAPGVIYREPVNEPLQTGIKSIDSMIPIGKGQRELIIGDRQTGKTTLAIDTIINQKEFYDNGSPVYCIYVSIGQKCSNVAKIAKLLKEHGAMKYTIIISANASDPASMQVFAPFYGTAIGEYFRDTGNACLIIYDDLSKHAVAYREISLLLRRPPGREAYPGDIFYLHSRLLERSSKIIQDENMVLKMNDLPKSIFKNVKGGGSLTSLPIIETQSGDVSSYIPTNVISITDGQIFLDINLFNNGIRPAINEGISVSRVGGAAQIHSMKKVSGKLKLDQAQYHDLVSFVQFGSDIDKITLDIINKGKRNIELLKQLPHHPYKIGDQIAIIYIGTNDFLKNIPLSKIIYFEKEYLEYLKYKYNDVLISLSLGYFNKDLTKKLDMAFDYVNNKFLIK